jgi:hypothetical protein
MSDELTEQPVPDVVLPPMHERPEYIKMRDALIDQIHAHANLPRTIDIKQLANKIAPVLYMTVETECLMHHLNAQQGARGMMLALNRIMQLDAIRLAVKEWRESAAINYLLDKHPNNLSPTERALAAAYATYLETRAKDN